jgi:hypothetical protein
MRFLVILVGAALALPAAAIAYLTHRTAHDPRQAIFAGGSIPDPLPNGAYRGALPGYEQLAPEWYGKRFDAAACTGSNLVRGADDHITETAPYLTYQDRSHQAPGHPVLRVDYNVPENPFWLRVCSDELVQLEPGHLLGKAYIRLIPGLPFAMLFFDLHAEDESSVQQPTEEMAVLA